MIENSIYVALHLPKCGGRSVFKAFKHIFGEDKVLNLYTNLFEEKKENELFIAFENKTLDLSKYRAICGGHLDFDSHRDCFQDRKPLYVTLVREPLERFISYFNYLSMADEEAKDLPGRFPSSNPSLVAIAKSCRDVEAFYHRLLMDDDPAWQTSNIQSSYITGHRDCAIHSVVDSLDSGFHLVMPLPLIDHFCAQIAAENGVTSMPTPHENYSFKRATMADITPEFRALFCRRAHLDYFTYYYVCAKALQRITTNIKDDRDKLADGLARLKKRQRLFSFVPGMRYLPDEEMDPR